MAPEVIGGKDYGPECDTWSLGVILYELLTLKRPFDATNLGALLVNIHGGRYDEAALGGCGHHPLLCELASREGLLHPEPTQRLSIEALRVRMLDVLYWDEGDTLNTTFGATRDALLEMLWPGGHGGKAEPSTTEGSMGEHSPAARTTLTPARTVAVSPPVPVPKQLADASSTFTKEQLLQLLQRLPLISADELRHGHRLGSGSFGEVYSGTWRTRVGGCDVEREVAVKSLTRGVHHYDAQILELCKEASLLCAARHENIVAVYGLTVGEVASIHLVMEYASGGSLFAVLSERRRRALARGWPLQLPTVAPKGTVEAVTPCPTGPAHPDLLEGRQLVRLLRGVAQGMAFLHGIGIVHRDLKSPNLLLNGAQTSAKVCDFGLSRHAFGTMAMTRVGSVQWASPEQLLGEVYGPRVDVWSFGVVTWEVLTGLIPYQGAKRTEVARGVAVGAMRLPVPSVHPERCPIELVTLLESMFSAAEERPEFIDVVQMLDVCEEKLPPFPEGRPAVEMRPRAVQGESDGQLHADSQVLPNGAAAIN
mmetsp:Transcript_22996/g.58542  ORF Transcript_22996/g.58542 Transcript_22996/m.58542 type:complete len:537 (+) Transcript_22996:184-1794(+)